MTGFEHGKTYTVVSYFYPDTRPGAPAATTSETFTFERGKGSLDLAVTYEDRSTQPSTAPAWPGTAPDRLTIGLMTITVRPGWLWREVMEGQYDTSGVKPTWKTPSNVVPFTGAGPAAAPTPGSSPTP